MADVANRVNEILTDYTDGEAVGSDTRFDELGLDSLDRIEILQLCEGVFGIEIPDDDAEVLDTVGQVVAYLNGRLVQEGRS